MGWQWPLQGGINVDKNARAVCFFTGVVLLWLVAIGDLPVKEDLTTHQPSSTQALRLAEKP